MIHYHGTPLTPRVELQKMAGKHFCVSFSDPRDGDWCLTHGQSVLWDNGAFTAHTKGRDYDVDAFYQWVEPRLGHPHWAVVPDVIDGGEEENDTRLETWPFDRSLGAPVWHLHESFDRLLRLADAWPRICFGSSAQYWQVGSALWERRVDEAFNSLERANARPWVHMLRGLAMAGDRWPFASADSVNVARNFKDQGVCPERMSRRIDAIQCPVRWATRHQQSELSFMLEKQELIA